MQDLIEMFPGDPLDRLGPAQLDLGIGGHVDRHPQGGLAGALAHPGLEHPQLALLDGELGVAHVAVVTLEPGEDGQQLGVDRGELTLQGRQGLGVADAGHHVLALRVDQVVPVLALFAGSRVSGEAHPGSRPVVPVPEHHGLHVDRSTELVGDPLPDPVGIGPGTVPRLEHGLDGPPKLVVGVLGEGLARVALHDLLVGVDQVTEKLGGDAGVGLGVGQLLGRIQQAVELLTGNAEDDPSVHGHEAPVGVEGEALVVGLLGQPDDRLVIEAQIEDGVHHPGHGELGPRTDRDQQRVGGVADALSHLLLEPRPGLGHLSGQALGPTGFHIGTAGVGGDGEPRGDGKVQYRCHLGQVGALATKEVFHLHGWLPVLVVEVVDKRHRVESPAAGRGGSTPNARTSMLSNRVDASSAVGFAGWGQASSIRCWMAATRSAMGIRS